MMCNMNAIQRAVEQAGSQAALAQMLQVRQPTVSEWARGERPVPVERCTAIEKATGGAVTRRELRPDDWHRIWPELITAEHPAPETTSAA